jgi:hypothetical protein
MAALSHSARPWAFKFTDTLVIAACAVAVLAIILASQPARPRPAAPVAVHLTEAEFAAAKCYALRAQIEARDDPAAVSAWSQKYNVDAQACRELLAKRAAGAAQ